MKLKIIHTNDVHSHYENFARAVSLIRQHADENTITLDGGDFADFRSIELQGTKGLAAIEMLESVGYSALTIGNNETFNGVDTLEHMASNSSVPFISNNLWKKDKSAVRGVVPSTIVDKNGIRILITGSSPDLGGFSKGLGLHFTAFKDGILKEIEKHKGNYDICLLLSHVGTFVDVDFAREIPEIDIIISAHVHELYKEAKVVNGTIMNSAGNFGEHVGIVEVEVDNGIVTLLHSETIETKDAPVDEEIDSILKKNKEIAVKNLSKPFYHLEKALWHDVVEENPLSNLIADGLKDMLNGDIGLINSGTANGGVFDFVSAKKLIEICPSPLNPTTFEIQGKHLQTALQQSLDAQLCLTDGRGPGFRGRFLGKLHVSGARIVHDGEKLLEVWIGEEPLEDEKWYTVASSDYLQRGSGYPSLANNEKEKYRPEEIRDVIRIYANKPTFVDQAFQNRWKKI